MSYNLNIVWRINMETKEIKKILNNYLEEINLLWRDL